MKQKIDPEKIRLIWNTVTVIVNAVIAALFGASCTGLI